MNPLFLKKYFYKYTDKKKYLEAKELKSHLDKRKKLTNDFIEKLSSIQTYLSEEKEINFMHSGHIGDIIYALPVIKKISETHTCNLYINCNQQITQKAYKHIAGSVYINDKLYAKLHPLLTSVDYLNRVEKFNNQKIHINLDLFREFPFDLNFITVRWYSHLTGVFPDFSLPSLSVEPHPIIKDKVIIIRSFRVRNSFVDYSFLRKYDDLLFVGLPDEYEDLKKIFRIWNTMR